ncbi:NALD2-like protein [Mya arenaria]|uniref:NALD2-like protein n=1 Tax=Mya arenaria TaxID=6604 RepID=A0ABY7FR29_MYAAR|nr:NALD2-like protein [Mya arenaria]
MKGTVTDSKVDGAPSASTPCWMIVLVVVSLIIAIAVGIVIEKPHLAGTQGNYELALKIRDYWDKIGVDSVTLTPYTVELSYPNVSDLNYVEIVDENGVSVYKSDLKFPVLRNQDNKTNIVTPFSAYSSKGDVKGNIVYVNYGRVEDFDFLENNASVSVDGKIVMARYGKIFRGNKVQEAERRGAIGVILYSDPGDIAADKTDTVYPDDWWLPPSGVQLGHVRMSNVGDPLTPFYPATATAYHKKDPDEYMPSIPCHPIGYGVAVDILRSLNGTEVPFPWRGKMNTTYRFGDSFHNNGWKAHIHVATYPKQAPLYNVIGIIKGEVEPDRYVIVGGQRDAWVFGALDPSSGTAVFLEMARVLAELVTSGRWRPRRSIVMCSWDAEEYGKIGSIEWVEQYIKPLSGRAVAYLNVDTALEGNYSLRALGTPLLYQPLYSAAQKVPNPNTSEIAAGRSTVYDTWFITSPRSDKNVPRISLPGSGSDYAPFRDRVGIPIMDIRYTWDRKMWKISKWPMYHTVYETFYLVDQIMDRGRAVGQVWLEMIRQLSDDLILPFNVTDLVSTVSEQTASLLQRFGKVMHENGIQTEILQEAVANLTDSVNHFEHELHTFNKQDPYLVRRINDQLMSIERSFIDPQGLPGRRYKHHLLFTESSMDNYAGSSYPGLTDALTRIVHGENVKAQWDVVHKHFSVLLFVLQSAQSVIKDTTDFMFSY